MGDRGAAYPVGDVDGDGVTDLAVGPLPDAQPTTPYAIDGRTLSTRPLTQPWVALDRTLDGDGADVITVDYAAGVLTVEALDARSGRLLWRAQRPVAIQGGGLSLLGVDVQDLTGDGTPEVIVNAYVTNNVDEAFIVTALDGATGAVLFTEQ